MADKPDESVVPSSAKSSKKSPIRARVVHPFYVKAWHDANLGDVDPDTKEPSGVHLTDEFSDLPPGVKVKDVEASAARQGVQLEFAQSEEEA